MSFIRLLLIFLAIYFVLRLLFLYVFPFLVKRYFKKMNNKYYNTRKTENRKEGEIRVEDTRNTKEKGKKISGNMGEYIDYEDISKD